MQVRLDDIVVGKKRIRKSSGDITQLMESLRKHGLLNPITVTEAMELIAGFRRFEAASRLGWESIDVHMISNLDDVEKCEIEIDENLHRRNFTTDELAEAYDRLKKLKNPGFFKRIWSAVMRFFRKLFRIK